jgi:phasin family protein
MKTLKPEQFAVAQQANTEVMLTLMRTTLDNIEKLASLNLGTLREALQQGASNASALLEVKDSKEAVELAKPTLERTRGYYHNLYDLVADMQKEITDIMESHYRTLTESAETAIEETSEQLPAGGDIFSTAMKSMLQASTQAFDRMNFMTQQMSEMAAANIKAVSDLTTPASAAKVPAKPAGSATRRAAAKK